MFPVEVAQFRVQSNTNGAVMKNSRRAKAIALVPVFGCTQAIATALLTVLIATSVACSDTPVADPNSERVLTTGRIVGLLNDRGAHEWRGLRLAAPPTGEQRWRPPRFPESWSGTRTALSFENPCPQYERTGEGVMGAEDCLFANVLAPSFAPGAIPNGPDQRPVMVWIHGGGNVAGHAAEKDWSALAIEHGVVVISLQYRLGALGWFRHPSLSAEDASPEERSGNFAVLDLVLGLRWVRDNAAAFGGDPSRVTVFGASAGAGNILSLLISPLSKGLYHRAIMQSDAGPFSSSTAEAENHVTAPEAGHPSSSHEVLLTLLRTAGGLNRAQAEQHLARMSQREIAALLRGTPVEQLLAAYPISFGPVYRLPMKFRDGRVLPAEPPLTVLRNGNFARVPVLLGSARDEVKLFMLIGDRSIQRIFGLPVRLRDPGRYQLLAEYGSRRWKARGVDQVAAAMSASGHSPVFAFRTDWDDLRRIITLDFKVLMGALHGVELPLLQDQLKGGGFSNLIQPDAVPAAQQLGAAMRSYWAEFAYHGDPGRGRDQRLPRWQAWHTDADEPAFLVFDAPADGGIRHSKKIESDHALLAAIVSDSRFQSECDRCEAIAGMVPGRLPDYESLPQTCSRFVSHSGVLSCSAGEIE